MNIAGIDLSTHAIDIVKLPFDDDQAEWTHHELHGRNGLERGLTASAEIPNGSYWDDVALVAIERPYGPGGDTLFALHLVVGSVAASLPDRLRPPWLLHPTEWRKHCGLPGNAPKPDVSAFSMRRRLEGTRNGRPKVALWPQDANDAYCIAYAARTINSRAS